MKIRAILYSSKPSLSQYKKREESMADGLDVIIVDDEPGVCEVVSEIVKRFYMTRYLKFSKKLIQDPAFAKVVTRV